MTTPLKPSKILLGKLLANLSYIILLIFAAIPLVSVVFVFGGVSIKEMAKAIVVLLVTAFTFGVIGLFSSAAFNRSGRATIFTYLFVILITFVPLMISPAYGMIYQGQQAPRWIFISSPIAALASSIEPSLDPQMVMSRFWMLGNPYWGIVNPEISLTDIPRPIYHYTLPFYGGLSLILYFISTRLVLPTRRWNIKLAEAVIGITFILGYLGIIGLLFFSTTNRYENVILVTPTPNPIELIPLPGMLEPPGLNDPNNHFLKPTFTPLPVDENTSWFKSIPQRALIKFIDNRISGELL